MLKRTAKGKYIDINEEKDLAASTANLNIGPIHLESSLKEFNNGNYQAAVASYNADLVITVALFLMASILLFMRLFSKVHYFFYLV
jgi:hypothetical protein